MDFSSPNFIIGVGAGMALSDSESSQTQYTEQACPDTVVKYEYPEFDPGVFALGAVTGIFLIILLVGCAAFLVSLGNK